MVVEGMMLASLASQMSPVEKARTQPLGARGLGESWRRWTSLGLTPEEGLAVFGLYRSCFEPNLK